MEAANSFQTLPPSPAISLIQWLQRTRLMYGGMISLKSFKENKEVLMDLLTSLATNEEEGQAIFETTVMDQISKWPLRKRSESTEHRGK